MSEEKAKRIHIEDGNAEAEKTKAEEKDEELKDEPAEAEEASKEEAPAEDKAEGNEDGGSETEEKSDTAEEKAEESKDGPSAEEQESERYMRLMAEFQNFKRRAAKEKTDIHAFANERIVGDLLPVLDNFERALDTETYDLEGYAKGMQLIFEQLKTALEKAGLSEIEALGCDFDPNVHNAVMTDNTEEYETDKISKVLQKGYKLNDKVIRPSMVAVNKK
jgi:molecular chaperone GrpE